MKSIEIELRYEVPDPAVLQSFTEKMTFTKRRQDKDIYFDTDQADLLSHGIFIRIRNNTSLEIKFNRECINNPDLPLQPYCEEHVFALPIIETDVARFNDLVFSLGLKKVSFQNNFFEQFKKQNNLIEHYCIDKKRTEYSYDIFTLAIDEVKELGTFLEIECMAHDTKEVASIEAAMQKLVEPLKLKSLETGYGTLFLRKNKFEHYLKSRFMLPEDRMQKINQK
jgi:adenylate cyclase class IV